MHYSRMPGAPHHTVDQTSMQSPPTTGAQRSGDVRGAADSPHENYGAPFTKNENSGAREAELDADSPRNAQNSLQWVSVPGHMTTMMKE
mmetsp:Transcript_102598/g.173891  ORF Transcript_102598/g.173891 Transcript_102598/m.173891 type:complete len:89 (+) Transcript_102598:45-311(+)